MGGLSQALTAVDAASKKRPLSLHPSLPSGPASDKEQLPQNSSLRTRSALYHQASYLELVAESSDNAHLNC